MNRKIFIVIPIIAVIMLASSMLVTTASTTAYVLVRKEAGVRDNVKLSSVDSQSIAKYVGLQAALSGADKKYHPSITCKPSPCIGDITLREVPDSSYQFNMTGAMAKVMINDPVFGFVTPTIPGSDVKIYTTHIRLGNSLYFIEISGI